MNRRSADYGRMIGSDTTDKNPLADLPNMIRRGWLPLVGIAASSAFLLVAERPYAAVAAMAVWVAVWARAAVSAKSLPWFVAALMVVGGLSLALAPAGSDLWSYHAHGRVASVHRANPYAVPPSAFPDDPVTGRVADFYVNSVSPYGPAFTAAAAVIGVAVPNNGVAPRLVWHSLAVIGLALTAWLLRTRGVPWSTVSVVTLCPLAAYQIGGLARNDVFVGLGLLATIIATQSRRWVLAGVFAAAAAMIKLPAAVVVVVIVAHLIARGERRAAIMVAAVTAAVSSLMIAPFGMRVFVTSQRAAGGDLNSTSIWNLVDGRWRSFVSSPATETMAAAPWMSIVAVLLSAAIAAWVGFRCAAVQVADAAAAAIFVTILVSTYPSPWFFTWLLPLIALGDERWSHIIVAWTGLLQITVLTRLWPWTATATQGRIRWFDNIGAPLLGLTTATGCTLAVWWVRTIERRAARA